MLVISRKKHEKVIVEIPPSDVPRTLVLQVIRCGGAPIRLGFEGPEEIRILRSELQGKGRAA